MQTELKETQDKVRNARRDIREAEKLKDQEQKAAAEEEQRTAQRLIDDYRKKLEDEQKKAKASIPDYMRDAMLALLDGGKAADLASSENDCQLCQKKIQMLPVRSLTPSQRIKVVLNSISILRLMTCCHRAKQAQG